MGVEQGTTSSSDWCAVPLFLTEIQGVEYMRRHVLFIILGLLLVSACALPAMAASVTPVVVDDNPVCTQLGYDFGYKVEPPRSGIYTVPGAGRITVTAKKNSFDWSSTFGIDAVIVKGGSASNLYGYDPPSESFGDKNLNAPINPKNQQPYSLSHMIFCYDYEVAVEKTVNASFSRSWQWSILKAVKSGGTDLFTGDNVTHRYFVNVTRTPWDSGWSVSGVITIHNPAPFAGTITGVTDVLSGGGSVQVDCGVSFPYTLSSGGTLECAYQSSTLISGDNQTNNAIVATSGPLDGGAATADVRFTVPTFETNPVVNVTDTYEGDLGSFNGNKSVSYSRTFTCDGDDGLHTNTALIVETGQSASTTIPVNCHALEVTKNATATLVRPYYWTMEKSADPTLTLPLNTGQFFEYHLTVNATSTDDWPLSGIINVYNPAPITATINGISDIATGTEPDIIGTVNCGVSFPYTLGAGDTLQCAYTADLGSVPSLTYTRNNATATLRNHAYDYQGNSATGGTTNFSGSTFIVYVTNLESIIDECINISDGAFSFGYCYNGNQITFLYKPLIGPFNTCGVYPVNNTAQLTTTDTGTTMNSSWTVDVTVPCPGG